MNYMIVLLVFVNNTSPSPVDYTQWRPRWPFLSFSRCVIVTSVLTFVQCNTSCYCSTLTSFTHPLCLSPTKILLIINTCVCKINVVMENLGAACCLCLLVICICYVTNTSNRVWFTTWSEWFLGAVKSSLADYEPCLVLSGFPFSSPTCDNSPGAFSCLFHEIVWIFRSCLQLNLSMPAPCHVCSGTEWCVAMEKIGKTSWA